MNARSSTGILLLLILLGACAAPAPQQPAAGFDKPLSFSILEDYDKGEELAEVEADFRLFRELGITTWRGSFGWDDYEPEPGHYDFAWLHRFARLAARHNIALRPYIAYTPQWAARAGGADAAVWNNPPASLAAWQRFVAQLAAAMTRHPGLLSFEIYNEQNSPLWWDGSAQDYAQVLVTGAAAVRAAGGDDQVLLGGLTYPDLDWLERTCAAPGAAASFDILPLHAYPETWPAEQALETWLQPGPEGHFHGEFLPLAEDACGAKRVWINEAGYATVPGRRSERDQANWWARAIASFAADPRIEHIGIYEIKDRPRERDVIGEPENYHLGLTYADRKKKLAFHTVQRLVGLLDTGVLTVADAALAVAVVDGSAVALYPHLFIRPDGTQVLLVWDKGGSPLLRIGLARPGRAAVEYTLDGSSRPYPDFDGRQLHLRLLPGEVRIFAIAPAGA